MTKPFLLQLRISAQLAAAIVLAVLFVFDLGLFARNNVGDEVATFAGGTATTKPVITRPLRADAALGHQFGVSDP